MKVKAIWEFEFDDTDLDPKQIDIPGLAVYTAQCELMHLLQNRELISGDFEFVAGDNNSVKQAEWLMKTMSFSHKPDIVYVKHECSHCGERCHTKSFESAAWEAYYKNHYNPELPHFCSNCGFEMTVLPKEG